MDLVVRFPSAADLHGRCAVKLFELCLDDLGTRGKRSYAGSEGRQPLQNELSLTHCGQLARNSALRGVTWPSADSRVMVAARQKGQPVHPETSKHYYPLPPKLGL